MVPKVAFVLSNTFLEGAGRLGITFTFWRCRRLCKKHRRDHQEDANDPSRHAKTSLVYCAELVQTEPDSLPLYWLTRARLTSFDTLIRAQLTPFDTLIHSLTVATRGWSRGSGGGGGGSRLSVLVIAPCALNQYSAIPDTVIIFGICLS